MLCSRPDPHSDDEKSDGGIPKPVILPKRPHRSVLKREDEFGAIFAEQKRGRRQAHPARDPLKGDHGREPVVSSSMYFMM